MIFFLQNLFQTPRLSSACLLRHQLAVLLNHSRLDDDEDGDDDSDDYDDVDDDDGDVQ